MSAPTSALAKPSKPFRARVKAVERYNVLRLADGRTLSLSGLDIPRPPGPVGTQARAALRDLVVGGEVGVEPAGDVDRYGHIPAQVRLEDGTPLRDELLRAGWARLRPRGGKGELAEAYDLEDRARASGTGLWANPDFAVRAPDADALAQLMDSFQIVEGLVIATGGPRARTYLNFGSDWRSDFTVVVERKLEKLLPEPVRDLAGARVQARGWIELVNGPSIWLEDARALRILS